MKTTLSTGADFIPVVGNIKSMAGAITGKDVIPGRKLSTTERIIAGSLRVIGGGLVKGAVKVVPRIGDEIAEKVVKNTQKVRVMVLMEVVRLLHLR